MPPSPKPPKARTVEIADEDTGLIRNHHVDPAARIPYENGEKEKRRVRGTKWFFPSGPDTGYWTRVILSFAHVAGGEYEDEAANAVRQFRRDIRIDDGDHDYRVSVGITTTPADRTPGCADTGKRIESERGFHPTPVPYTASSTGASGTAA
ncbi:hypothetical protein ABT083_22800 [Streptomyces goshikiensis]|uniref:hypothetical protein n=1 Tax=Streptomyces goshikiensis TaxID=1942 RepID=UPI00332A8800